MSRGAAACKRGRLNRIESLYWEYRVTWSSLPEFFSEQVRRRSHTVDSVSCETLRNVQKRLSDACVHYQ